MEKPVEITNRAAEEIKHILEKKNIPEGYGLRVGIKGGRGCAGVNYSLGFDKPREKDVTYDIDGIPVYIQKGEVMFLIGKQVDFYDGSDARGFVFTDPSSEESSTDAR
jgi:iron-sulfur cluster assembly protein